MFRPNLAFSNQKVLVDNEFISVDYGLPQYFYRNEMFFSTHASPVNLSTLVDKLVCSFFFNSGFQLLVKPNGIFRKYVFINTDRNKVAVTGFWTCELTLTVVNVNSVVGVRSLLTVKSVFGKEIDKNVLTKINSKLINVIADATVNSIESIRMTSILVFNLKSLQMILFVLPAISLDGFYL
ncbi:hypothetical protein PYW08_005294 [Mythimna loreyi]|uniref:Uncharacterized protein n=1 Tax=Mythimna loreyi TaxID=667449 RepID=A0ACC2QJP6_9NEOP|nr:hypothetical protein PYW08_005294 [Mythimna loreyi]